MIKNKPRVAVLGAGIMGASIALFLTRRGVDVHLFDAAGEAFSAASRWNEGKIHLGYLYSADTGLRTAEHVMPGGLRFRPLVEELVGCSIAPACTVSDDVFLCHSDSVVSPDAMEAYMGRVTQRLREHPDAAHYLADLRGACMERLDAAELAGFSGSARIVAGFRVPERSVETNWVADRFIEALEAEPRIERFMGVRVLAVASRDGSDAGPWSVVTSSGEFGPYGLVINALWQGRMAVDRTAGIEPQGVWSNRYRQSLFVRTREVVRTPCAVIATGPFGDVKNYNGRDFYLSWYPAGLRADSSELSPPEAGSLEMPDPGELTREVFRQLEQYLPWVGRIREQAERVAVEGGWVFAAGKGSLSDPAASLHRRSDYGVLRKGSYWSVDTGKYSTAPWLAGILASQIS